MKFVVNFHVHGVRFRSVFKTLPNIYEETFCGCNQRLNPYYVKSVRIRSFSGPYFPAFDLNTEIYRVHCSIQSECGKIRTRKTPNMVTFHPLLSTVFTKVSITNIWQGSKCAAGFLHLDYFESKLSTAVLEGKYQRYFYNPFKIYDGAFLRK